jgi:flagellar assembly protein FliH
MRDTFSRSEAERSWVLVADPGLSRGDCRIITDTSLIDATLEKRLAAITSQLLGGERVTDKNPTPE